MYFYVPLQNLQLPLQWHEFRRGDTEAENIRQIGGHQRHLGHLVDLADPLHGVQGVAQEMGIQLGLEHPDLGLVQGFLVFQKGLLVGAQGGDHVVELPGKLCQLVFPAVNGYLNGQIVFFYPANGPVQPPDGLKNLAAQL